MKFFKQITEQYREKGRFHPVKPHNVGSVAAASPRKESDSANVKLKEDEQIDEIVASQVKGDMKSLNAFSFYKKHGIKKTAAKQKITEKKDEEEYGYEGDMALNQLATLMRCEIGRAHV